MVRVKNGRPSAGARFGVQAFFGAGFSFLVCRVRKYCSNMRFFARNLAVSRILDIKIPPGNMYCQVGRRLIHGAGTGKPYLRAVFTRFYG